MIHWIWVVVAFALGRMCAPRQEKQPPNRCKYIR